MDELIDKWMGLFKGALAVLTPYNISILFYFYYSYTITNKS